MIYAIGAGSCQYKVMWGTSGTRTFTSAAAGLTKAGSFAARVGDASLKRGYRVQISVLTYGKVHKKVTAEPLLSREEKKKNGRLLQEK